MNDGYGGNDNDQNIELHHVAPQPYYPTVDPLRGVKSELLFKAVAMFNSLPRGTPESVAAREAVDIATQTLFDAHINKKNGQNRQGLIIVEYSLPAAEDRIIELRGQAIHKFVAEMLADGVDMNRSIASYALRIFHNTISSWNRSFWSKTGRGAHANAPDKQGCGIQYHYEEPHEEAREQPYSDIELGIGDLQTRDIRSFRRLIRSLSNVELIQLWMFFYHSANSELGYTGLRNMLRRRNRMNALDIIEICFEQKMPDYAHLLCDEFLLELVRNHRPEQRFARMIRLAECGGLYGAQLIYSHYGFYDRERIGKESYDQQLSMFLLTARNGTLIHKGKLHKHHPHIRAMMLKMRKKVEKAFVDEHLVELYGKGAFERLAHFLETEDFGVLVPSDFLILEDERFAVKTGRVALELLRMLISGQTFQRVLTEPGIKDKLPAQAIPLDKEGLVAIRMRLMQVLRDLSDDSDNNDRGEIE